MRALQRFGSGHKSNGVCPFLFFMYNSAPFATKKQAMDAELFLSPKMEKDKNIIEFKVIIVKSCGERVLRNRN